MNLTIRLETSADHYTVENITREAFTDWKKHREGGGVCDEHLLVHKLRKDPVYVPELNYVAELDGRIVGHIIYSRSKIVGTDGVEHEVLTFGPISVLPELQKRGIGRALIEHTTAEAKRLGYKGILIHGHPDYYPRFGFKRAREFGLTPEHDPCMAMELIPGALNIPGGHFSEAPVFFDLPQKEVEEFDKRFTINDIQILSLRDNPEREEDCRLLLLEHFNEFTSKHPAEVLASEKPLPQGYFMLKDNRVVGWVGIHEKEVVSGKVYGWEGTLQQEEVLSENLSPWITPLLIHPDERGNCYGKMLLEHARKEAGQLGFKLVYLTTGEIRFYEKYGFREVGLTTFTWGRPTKVYEAEVIS
jgi:predicted N-acetyltransferase YhbS